MKPERRKRPALAAWFVVSAAVILTVTGAAKGWTAFAPTKVLVVADPITGLSFGHLVLAVGVLELVIASICLFAKLQTLKLGLIAWLATNFVVYRLGLWWIGWKKPCSCLGNLTDALHLKPEVADNIMKVILAYLLLGSYGLLIWRFRFGRVGASGGRNERKFTAFLALIIFVSNPVSAEDGFQISGSCKSFSYGEDGKSIQDLDFEYQVRMSDEMWLIRLVDLQVLRKTRQSFDVAETVFDGTDLFRTVHFPDSVKSSAEAKQSFGVYGSASLKAFPSQSTPVEQVLWYSFCSAKSGGFSISNLPAMTDSMVGTNVSRVEVDYFGDGPRLPRNLKIYLRGIIIGGSLERPETRLLKLPAPYDADYLAFELQSTASDISGSFLPKSISAKFYDINFSEQPPKHYVGTQIEIIGGEARRLAAGGAIILPEMKEPAVIHDSRFTNSRGHPFQYIETNNSWVARTSSNPVAELERKPIVKSYVVNQTGPVSKPSKLSRVVIVILMTLLSAVSVSILIRSARNKNNAQ